MIIWDFLMISGGLFSLFLMTAQLCRKKIDQLNWITAGIYLCHAFIVIFKGLSCSGIIKRYTMFMHWDLYTFYAIGPMIYLYLKKFIEESFVLKKTHLLLFSPIIIIVILYLPFSLKTPAEKILLFPYYIKVEEGFIRYVMAASYLIPGFLVGLYSFLALRFVSLKKTIKVLMGFWQLKFILILTLECVLMAGFMVYAYFNWSYNIYRFIMLTLNQIVFFFYILNERYPDLSLYLMKEMRNNSKQFSYFSRTEADAAAEKLNDFIKRKRPYLNPDLTLELLSRELYMTTHQLSELLNKHLNTNFKTYINHFRIEESKYLLRYRNDLNIIEVVFASGFKSKSSFNALFSKKEGLTPTIYRKSESLKS